MAVGMTNMTEIVNWTLLLIGMGIGAVVGGPGGYYYARTRVWWGKKRTHLTAITTLLKAGAVALGSLALIVAVGIKAVW